MTYYLLLFIKVVQEVSIYNDVIIVSLYLIT